MAETEKSKKQTKSLSTHVRFSEEEYKRILRERDVTGKSIPALLKVSHFSRSEIVPLMHPKDQKSISSNVSMILEECKKLSERASSLSMSELAKNINELNEKVHALFVFVTGANGHR